MELIRSMAVVGSTHVSVLFYRIDTVTACHDVHATIFFSIFEEADPFMIHSDNDFWRHDSCVRPFLFLSLSEWLFRDSFGQRFLETWLLRPSLSFFIIGWTDLSGFVWSMEDGCLTHVSVPFHRIDPVTAGLMAYMPQSSSVSLRELIYLWFIQIMFFGDMTLASVPFFYVIWWTNPFRIHSVNDS